jgi:fibronectin type 3 domain-containing protein
MSKRSSILLALLFVIAIGAMGCGDSTTSVENGDTVAPAAVLDLGAVAVNAGSTHSIEVNWSAGTESDLAGYNVYRSVNGAVETLVSVESANTFTDNTVEAGSSYSYAVSAVDLAGNESARQTTANVLVWDGTTHRGGRTD